MATKEELILTVEADTRAAMQGLDILEAEAEKLGREDIVVRVRVARGEVAAESQAALAALNPLKAGVDVPINVSGSSVKQIGEAAKGFDALKGHTSSTVTGLRDVSQALGGAGDGALQTTEAMLGMGEALGQLSPRLAGMVSNLGPIGLGIAAAAVGVDAFFKALDKLGGISSTAEQSFANLQAGTGDLVTNMEKARKAAQNKELFDWFKSFSDLDPLNQWAGALDLGVSTLDEFNKLLKEAPGVAKQYADQVNAAATAQGKHSEETDKINKAMADYIDAQVTAASGTRALNEEIGLRNKLEAEGVNTMGMSIGQLKQEAFALDANADAAKANAAAVEKSLDARKRFSEGVGAAADSVNFLVTRLQAFAGMDELIDFYDRVHASGTAFAQDAGDTAEGFDAVKESIKKLPRKVSLFESTSEDARSALDDVAGLGKAIDQELGDALAHAKGDYGAVKAKAAEFTASLTEQLTAMGVAPGRIQEVLTALHLLPGDVDIKIKLSQDEEARRKLDTFKGVIDQLPLDKQVEIQALASSGQVQEAYQVLVDTLNQNPDIPIDVKAQLLAASTGQTIEEARATLEASGALPIPTTIGDPDLLGAKDGWEAAMAGSPVTIPTKLEVSANQAADLFEGRVAGMGGGPTIKVAADVAPATTAITAVTTKPWAAKITASADTSAAASAIASLTRARTVPISIVVNAPGFESAVAGAVQRWMSRNGKVGP